MFSSENIQLLLLSFPLLVFSLSVHECAHAWTALKGGDDTAALLGRVTLNPISHVDPIGTVLFPILGAMTGFPFLGWARPVPVNPMRLKRQIWYVYVIAAGPLSNLLIAACMLLIAKAVGLIAGHGSFFAVLRMIDSERLAEALGSMTMYGIMLNVILAVFNMLPIPPLDGSKIFYYFIVAPRRELWKAWTQFETFGFTILYVLILMPVTSNAFGEFASFIFRNTKRFLD